MVFEKEMVLASNLMVRVYENELVLGLYLFVTAQRTHPLVLGVSSSLNVELMRGDLELPH